MLDDLRVNLAVKFDFSCDELEVACQRKFSVCGSNQCVVTKSATNAALPLFDEG
jgi:hypothetical protein